MAVGGEESGKVVVFLVILGSTLLLRGWRRHWQKRRIQDTPCSDIRSAAQGLVEVQGFALPGYGEGFICLQDRGCVFRRIRIEEWVKKDKNSRWVKVLEEDEGGEFIVSDGTGIARVIVNQADLLLDAMTYPWKVLTTAQQQLLVDRYGKRVRGLEMPGGGFWSGLTRREFRVIESVIRIGSPVYIRGYFESLQSRAPYLISPRFLAFLAKIEDLRKNPAERMKAFDLDRDGKISEFELMKGAERLLYLAKDDIDAGETMEQVAVEGLIRYTPLHGLLIGDSHQEPLLRRIGGKGTLKLIGGAALIAAAFGWIAFLLS
jgi:hypothetical protein